MYGSSQETIGYALGKLAHPNVFSADKVWTSSQGAGQIEESRRHWGVPRFDLLQVHNLLGWDDHLPLLFSMKKAGHLRYVGVTTSHGRRLEELEQIMRKEPLDFIQLTYNPIEREPEQRILPLRSEEHTSELQSHSDLVCRLLLEKKKKTQDNYAELKILPTTIRP